jgi:hypothetical protein
MYETQTFEHSGKEYEIRIVSEGHTTHVRAFLDGKPANGYSYSVEHIPEIDIPQYNSSSSPVKELIETAISDVKNGIWEQYLDSVRKFGGSK